MCHCPIVNLFNITVLSIQFSICVERSKKVVVLKTRHPFELIRLLACHARLMPVCLSNPACFLS